MLVLVTMHVGVWKDERHCMWLTTWHRDMCTNVYVFTVLGLCTLLCLWHRVIVLACACIHHRNLSQRLSFDTRYLDDSYTW